MKHKTPSSLPFFLYVIFACTAVTTLWCRRAWWGQSKTPQCAILPFTLDLTHLRRTGRTGLDCCTVAARFPLSTKASRTSPNLDDDGGVSRERACGEGVMQNQGLRGRAR